MYIKILAISLMCIGAFAFPPDMVNSNLLSDNGVLKENSLTPIKSESLTIIFGGEIVLSGVLERVNAYEEGEITDSFRFYPDKNLTKYIPFVYYNIGAYIERLDFSDQNLKQIKFEPIPFGIALKMGNLTPKSLSKRIFGTSSMRVEVQLKEYGFYSEGDAGRDAWATLVSIKELGKAYYTYNKVPNFELDGFSCDCYPLLYNSKDDYVNLRESPNGTIITRILKQDMLSNGAVLVTADVDYPQCDTTQNPPSCAGWIKVWYFPPHARDGRDGILGVVHGSQITFNK